MKNKIIVLPLLVLLTSFSSVVFAEGTDPHADQEAMIKYFNSKFPNVPNEEYANGIYALDEDARKQWMEAEEFPPYEFEIDQGKKLFETAFANGKSYQTCMDEGQLMERHKYPYFDTVRETVITLELAINECRVSNGEKRLKWKKGAMAQISGYLSMRSKGETVAVTIPNDDALKAYEDGKKFYFSQKGYLNNSCATCHVQGAGLKVRTELLHPLYGEITHTPIYRIKWGSLGTLHRRVVSCHRDQGAKKLKAQSETYRNLEYFMSFMSNGLKFNGPAVRK